MRPLPRHNVAPFLKQVNNQVSTDMRSNPTSSDTSSAENMTRKRTAGSKDASCQAPAHSVQNGGRIIRGRNERTAAGGSISQVEAKFGDDDDPSRPPESSSDDSDDNGMSRRGQLGPSEFQSSGGNTDSSTTDGVKTRSSIPRGDVERQPATKLPERKTQKTKREMTHSITDEESTTKGPASKKKKKTSKAKGNPFPDWSRSRKPNQTYGRKGSPQAKSLVAPSAYQPKEVVSPVQSLRLAKSAVLGSNIDSSPNPVLQIPKEFNRDPAMSPSAKESSFKARLSKRRANKTAPDSPEQKFIIPELISSGFPLEEEDMDDDDGDEILDAAVSPLEGLDSSDLTKDPTCPLCGAVVKQDLLNNFLHGQKRMDFSQKRRFCKLHKRKTARDTWRNRGYPDIDWKRLESRIAKRHDMLRGFLKGGESYYRDEFSKKVKAGQAKNISSIIKSDQSLIPGYYGARGLSLMSDAIIREFSSLLRERTVQDRLISARGYTAYVQSVLVPELTVELIKEDMSVDSDEAREILRTSTSLGELLHEDVRDVVKDEEADSDVPISPLTDFAEIDEIESD